VTKELRFPGGRLLTTEGLTLFSPDGRKTTIVALKIEKKENGVEVGFVEETFHDGHLPFRDDPVLDEHGTVEAAMHVLSRHFWLEKMTEIEGGIDVWRRRAKRLEYLDLWIIVQWEGWNVAGIRWDERNYLAQTESGEMSLGKMELKTFVRRCTRLGLKYPRYEKVKCKRGTNCGLNLFH
jgi:hypothetical protein